ncbi:MAG: glyoxalase superfamily protein [Kineosporiaceae bacterium]
MTVYKILLPGEWSDFRRDARFTGSPMDHADGFVHCSTAEQVPRTAARFFADAGPLVVLAVDETLLPDVRWEVSGSGERFPHVYGPLPIGAVLDVHEVADAGAVAGVVPVPGPGPAQAIPVLRVADAALAVRWYARLGFVEEFRHRFEPHLPLYVGVVRDAARLHLSEHAGDARPDTLVYLWVPDVDKCAAACGAAVSEQPWGREFEVRDPWGNRLRVASPAS